MLWRFFRKAYPYLLFKYSYSSSVDGASDSYAVLIKLSEVVSLLINGVLVEIFDLTELEVEHSCVDVDLIVTFL